MIRLIALLGLLLAPTLAWPVAYRVDLVIFSDNENLHSGGGELPDEPRTTDMNGVFELQQTAELRDTGIYVLQPEQFALTDELRHLSNSRRFEPLMTVSWVQVNPPVDNGPALRLRFGDELRINDVPLYFGDQPTDREPETVQELDGTVTLLLSRYLHLDADLSWTQTDEYGQLGSYHLQESRRMRSGELHHLDSPRFGLLAKIGKVSDEQMVELGLAPASAAR